MTLDASNLRRIRLQHGISLTHIAQSTKIAGDLLAGLERNDFSQWPTGIYARAWVRQYAAEIGADADRAIDEFCRYFPAGDRRAEPLVRELSAILDARSAWRDDDDHQRRAADRHAPQETRPHAGMSTFLSRLRRVLLAPR